MEEQQLGPRNTERQHKTSTLDCCGRKEKNCYGIEHASHLSRASHFIWHPFNGSLVVREKRNKNRYEQVKKKKATHYQIIIRMNIIPNEKKKKKGQKKNLPSHIQRYHVPQFKASLMVQRYSRKRKRKRKPIIDQSQVKQPYRQTEHRRFLASAIDLVPYYQRSCWACARMILVAHYGYSGVSPRDLP